MKIIGDNNNISTFKKSTLCWLLNEKVRLPTDRLQRYIHDQRRKDAISNGNRKVNAQSIRQEDAIKKGDFIILKCGNFKVLMEVLNFQYFAKTLKARRYPKNVCSLNTQENIGVTGNTHLISETNKLFWNPDSQYLHINNYMCHVEKTLFDLGEKSISPILANYIMNN